MRRLPFRPDSRVTLALVAAMAALGAAHVLIRTWTYGAAVGFDAVYYLAAAENLAAGAGLRGFDGTPFVHWPPLFPMLLAPFELAGMDAGEVGRWINAIAFGLIVLVSGIWLTRNLRSRFLALLGTFAVLIAYPLIDRSAYLMTEPLFILLTLLALLQVESFLKSGRKGPLLAGAVLFGLAAATRYTGIIGLIVGTLLAILRRGAFSMRIKAALAFGMISSLPLAGALIYNWTTARSLAGDRRAQASDQSLLDSMKQILSVLDQWIIPGGKDFLEFLYVPFAFFFLLIVFHAIPQRMYSRFFSSDILPFGLFALVYLGMIASITPLATGTPIDSRYLLPVYVPMILVIFRWGDKLLSIVGGSRVYQYALLSVVMIGFLTHSGFMIERTLADTAKALERGYPDWLHHTAAWEESETLSWLEDNPVSGRVYSPAFDLVWYHSGAPASEGRYRWSGEGFAALVGRIPAGGAHLVLVVGGPVPEAEYADTIRFLPGVEVLGEFSDGGVYRFPRDGALTKRATAPT